jgi:pimeloyl-ACP methyl ester carboxylesterase
MTEKLPIYFLPGTLCSEATFSHQINTLTSAGYLVNVVQFTTERSIDEMVDTCLEKMNNSLGVIIGFSMGGIVALALAKKHPALIKKLCLIGSNCHADLPERQAPRQQHIREAKDKGLTDVLSKYYLPNYLLTDNQQLQQLILNMAEALGISCFEAQLTALSTREDTLAVLETLTCPVLLLAGSNDKLCNAEHQMKMHQHCPNSDLVLLSRSGHFPMLERASTTSTLLLSWLNP